MAVGAQRPPIEALADAARQVAAGSDLRAALAAIAAATADALGAELVAVRVSERTATSWRARSRHRSRCSPPRSRAPAGALIGSPTGSLRRQCCGSLGRSAQRCWPSRPARATVWSARSRSFVTSRSARPRLRSRRSRPRRSGLLCARSHPAPMPRPTRGASRGSTSPGRRWPPAGTSTARPSKRFGSPPLRPARGRGSSGASRATARLRSLRASAR